MVQNYSLSDLQKIQLFLEDTIKTKIEIVEGGISLNDFGNDYLNYIFNNLSSSYHRSVSLTINHFTKFFSNDIKLSSIGVKEAESFKSYVIKSASRGYLVYLRNAKAMFNVAISWELLESNPFCKIKFGRKQTLLPVFFNVGELENILTATKDPIFQDLFTFAFYTGTRLSEIINLRWSNINLQNREIVIGDKDFTTKSKKQRTIPMCNRVYDILERKHKNDFFEFVFHKPNGFLFCKHYVSRKFKNICRQANLPHEIHFHSLRHSFGSFLAKNGVPIHIIKELLGHSTIRVTEIYLHTISTDLHKAIETFNSNNT